MEASTARMRKKKVKGINVWINISVKDFLKEGNVLNQSDCMFWNRNRTLPQGNQCFEAKMLEILRKNIVFFQTKTVYFRRKSYASNLQSKRYAFPKGKQHLYFKPLYSRGNTFIFKSSGCKRLHFLRETSAWEQKCGVS